MNKVIVWLVLRLCHVGSYGGLFVDVWNDDKVPEILTLSEVQGEAWEKERESVEEKSISITSPLFIV